MWKETFRLLLNQEFSRISARNPKFSLRAFARKLEIAPGSLSTFLRGRETFALSETRAIEMLAKTSIPRSERNKLLVQMGKTPEQTRRKISAEAVPCLTDRLCLAVLAAHDLPGEFRSPRSISEKLGLPLPKVKEIITSLRKHKLLDKAPDGQLYRPEVFFSAGDGPADSSIKTFHRESLQTARTGLDKVPVNERDFSSLTFVGNQAKLEFLQKEIRNLYLKASTLVDAGESNETVFQMCVQVFPVDKRIFDA